MTPSAAQVCGHQPAQLRAPANTCPLRKLTPPNLGRATTLAARATPTGVVARRPAPDRSPDRVPALPLSSAFLIRFVHRSLALYHPRRPHLSLGALFIAASRRSSAHCPLTIVTSFGNGQLPGQLVNKAVVSLALG
jgi:hypothetical protein